MFFRVKSAGSYQYLQIVHSVRQGEKVRQQVFGTLGRLDELKASGWLEALIRSGVRHCEKFALIDAHAPGEPQAVTVQRIGADLVFERRYIVCLNEEERRKDGHDREAIVAHLKEQLRSGDKSLAGNKGYRRYLRVKGSGHFVIDEEQVKAEERYDGIWVLRTNTVYNTETVAHVYKALWTVEDIIRTSKSILETRPIYHKRDATIRGHVFCSFLALVLHQELETRIKLADLEVESKLRIRGLDGLQQV